MYLIGEVSAAGMLTSSLQGWIHGVLAKQVHRRQKQNYVLGAWITMLNSIFPRPYSLSCRPCAISR